MAGRGPAPKPESQRRTRHAPQRGDWQARPDIGWQHGPVPAVPVGLMPATVEAWTTWMRSWVAAHWAPDDLPGLRQIARLYDQVERGEFVRMTELRMMLDTYGITPKGQQDRRWTRPEGAETITEKKPAAISRYAHLRIAQ